MVAATHAAQDPPDVGLGRRLFVPLALVASVVPLLWPAVPPLIDLPGHMSRYRIALDIGSSPYLHRWFDYHWALVGNLGVDLLVALLAPATGLEPAVKLVVTMIPLLTVAAMALIAREAHGRVPLTAALAFPFAYNYPFNYGFVNFTLAAALALLALWLWLTLGRLERRALRTVLFIPIGCLTWLAHVYGWGMLAVMVFAAELVERRGAQCGIARSIAGSAIACLPLAPPLLAMLHWVDGRGATFFDYDVQHKAGFLFAALKTDRAWADLGLVGIVWFVLTIAVKRPDIRFDPRVAGAAAAMLAVYLLMPSEIMGFEYADMRLGPYVLILFTLAFRPVSDTRFVRRAEVAAVGLALGWTAYLTMTYAALGAGLDAQLAALDHIPAGSRVFGLARADCVEDWHSARMDHVNRMAIVRRAAYTNDTWPADAVSRTLFAHPDLLTRYDDFNSQRLLPARCRTQVRQTIGGALTTIPRDRFDYVWLIDVPARQWPTRTWLQPVWHGDRAILYRILPPGTRPLPGVARRLAAG